MIKKPTAKHIALALMLTPLAGQTQPTTTFGAPTSQRYNSPVRFGVEALTNCTPDTCGFIYDYAHSDAETPTPKTTEKNYTCRPYTIDPSSNRIDTLTLAKIGETNGAMAHGYTPDDTTVNSNPTTATFMSDCTPAFVDSLNADLQATPTIPKPFWQSQHKIVFDSSIDYTKYKWKLGQLDGKPAILLESLILYCSKDSCKCTGKPNSITGCLVNAGGVNINYTEGACQIVSDPIQTTAMRCAMTGANSYTLRCAASESGQPTHWLPYQTTGQIFCQSNSRW